MIFPTLLEELDRATGQGPSGRSAQILEQIAALFSAKADTYSDRQIDLFDEIFVRLVSYIEQSARVVLSNQIADHSRAPKQISRLLAQDDEIGVAGPVIERSKVLDRATLLAIATTKSQQHLLALSRRPTLEEAVTDVLVERGDAVVLMSTVRNAGARFSQQGFGRIVDRSHGNDELAATLGLRGDLPREHLVRLLVRASHEVRTKLEAANPGLAAPIQQAIEGAAGTVLDEANTLARDYSEALAELQKAHAQGQLQDAAIAALASADEFEKTVAALGLLCGLPPAAVEAALCHERTDGVLVLAKAAGLSWPTTKAMLRLRKVGRDMSPGEYERCAETFASLRQSTARQALELQKRSAQRTRFGRAVA